MLKVAFLSHPEDFNLDEAETECFCLADYVILVLQILYVTKTNYLTLCLQCIVEIICSY